jgi:hypothetical protein
MSVRHVLLIGGGGYLHLPDMMNLRGPFKKFVDWRQCAPVMPTCSGGVNVVVA